MKLTNLSEYLTLWLLCTFAVCRLAADEPEQPIPFRAVSFSTDGKLLAAGYGEKDVPGGVVIWNAADRSIVRQVTGDIGVSTVAFSPDGNWLAFTKYDQPPEVLDLATGELIWSLADPCRGPVAFSADGQVLACGAADKGIHLFDVKTRNEQKVLEGAKDRTYGRMSFSPDRKLLATACGRDGAYIWDLASGKPSHHINHGQYFVRSAEFTPDGEWIITGGYDGNTRIWNARTGKARARLYRVGGSALAISRDSKMLVLSGERTASVFQIELGQPSADTVALAQERLSELESDSYLVRQRASEMLVALGLRAESILHNAAENSPDAEVRIRARLARQRILSEPNATLRGHTSDVSSVAISPDGQTIASASDDGSVRLWDASSFKETAVLRMPASKRPSKSDP